MTTATGFPGQGRLLPFRDVEKRKPSSTAGGTVLGVALQKVLQRFLKKLKSRTTIYPAMKIRQRQIRYDITCIKKIQLGN